MYIMGLDLGYSSVKVVVANEYGEILKKFKFPSLIGITKKLMKLKMIRFINMMITIIWLAMKQNIYHLKI